MADTFSPHPNVKVKNWRVTTLKIAKFPWISLIKWSNFGRYWRVTTLKIARISLIFCYTVIKWSNLCETSYTYCHITTLFPYSGGSVWLYQGQGWWADIQQWCHHLCGEEEWWWMVRGCVWRRDWALPRKLCGGGRTREHEWINLELFVTRYCLLVVTCAGLSTKVKFAGAWRGPRRYAHFAIDSLVVAAWWVSCQATGTVKQIKLRVRPDI